MNDTQDTVKEAILEILSRKGTELSNLETYLNHWQSRINIHKLMIENQSERKHKNYSELINKINAIDIEYLSDQLNKRKLSYSELPNDLDNILQLANQDELKKVSTLKKIDKIISRIPEDETFDNIKSRFRIIRGTLLWNIKYNSYRRLYKTKADLDFSENELGKLQDSINNLQSTDIYNPDTYKVYKTRILSLEAQIDSLLARTRNLKLIQQSELQLQASDWLKSRLTHTSNLLARTQLAIARLQDKAASGAQ